jgi:phenylpyruvate tautomerase
MPLLKMQVSVNVPDGRKAKLLADASRIVAETTGKPEKYVMVVLETGDFLMGGGSGPAAFLDVRGIGGLTKAVNGKLTKALCDLLRQELAIDPAHVYATFTDVAAQNWGCNGATFG